MESSESKVAILGGTFNPVHLGHLLIAEQVYEAFSLDQVVFMPAGLPPHKIDKKIIPGSDRLQMVRMAIRGNPHFTSSDLELRAEGRSYTARTLRRLRAENPLQQVFFIIGADSLLDIFNWKEPDFLLENGRFIVARRPGFPLEEVLDEERYRPYRNHIYLFDSLLIDISSTDIRQRIKQDLSIRYLTDDAVINYIKEHGFYQEG